METETYEIIPSEILEKEVEIESITEENIEEAIKIGEKLIQTSVALGGAGLSATQVGINKNIMVYSYNDDSENVLYKICFNPKYFPREKKLTKTLEGCLSYPNKTFIMKRWKYITAVYDLYSKDLNEFIKISKNLRGEEAIVFQHEVDHLKNKHCAIIGEEISAYKQ